VSVDSLPLKVWLGLRHVGRDGYIQMIGDDIALSEALSRAVGGCSELQVVTQSLSITTFRLIPPDLSDDSEVVGEYLNKLNEELVNRRQAGGEAFISNAGVDGKYLLRACIINFRTTLSDVEALPEIVIRLGTELDSDLRPESLRSRPGIV